MKIIPVILCGGAGTRLWTNSKNYQAKQFINFGGWSLLEKTLYRIKSNIYDYPIISTNSKYIKNVKSVLKKCKISKYKIILEPSKRNTGPAILSSALIKSISYDQPMIFFPSDHLIENNSLFNKILKKNKKYLNNRNIFLFGIKPKSPSNEYGYFIIKKINKNVNKVIKFIEKPPKTLAKSIIKRKGYWNSGIFFARKDSIVNNFKNYQPLIYKKCFYSVFNSKLKNNVYLLNKKSFSQAPAKSFDYAILEKNSHVNALLLDVKWSDLGNWGEILKLFNDKKSKFFYKKNVFFRPWGKYVNLFKGKNFLIKELTVKSKSSISLQKHKYRSEHWVITGGRPKITINNKKFFIKKNEKVFIPVGSIHRIENLYNEPVKIMEAQIGSILRESDIIRYKDIYGRVN